MKKDIKAVDIPATIKKVNKDKKNYYNLVININGMDVQVEPKFLNEKQKRLYVYKLAQLMGDK